MKKLLTLLIASIATTQLMATENQISCPTVVLSGTLSDRTLDKDSIYLLRGCVSVPSGVTITAEAGVIVMGEKSTTGGIVFRKGSEFISQGTSSLPVVFTSDQTASNKLPGDWAGIAFEGYAKNNQSNSITLSAGRTCSITGGGTNDNDYSGDIKFMRIEYAINALTMVSVGDQTVFHDVMVAEASQNAYEWYGGRFNAYNLISLNARGIDLLATHGNRSKAQNILNVRLDGSSYLASGDSYSIVFRNNDDAINSYVSSTGAANNHPILDKVTILGPRNCSVTSINSKFVAAVLYEHNTEGTISNSVISGYTYGLRMEDASTLDQADVNYKLNFFSNSFYSNSNEFGTGATWPNNCSASMSDWIQNSGSFLCSQPDNQLQSPSYTLGYDASICSSFSTTPSFTIGSTDLQSPEYPEESDLDNVFFTNTGYRGAISETDWTEGWSAWNPQAIEYCSLDAHKGIVTGVSSNVINKTGLTVSPNPSTGIAYAKFETLQTGEVSISIVNSMGQTVRTNKVNAAKGLQKISINTDGLASGIYLINVNMAKEAIGHVRIAVK